MTDEKQKTRFNQFIKSIEGINPKTLSIRLKEMKEMGVIEKSFSK
jgi:DNA-binding HxlR family transcriptional regulator